MSTKIFFQLAAFYAFDAEFYFPGAIASESQLVSLGLQERLLLLLFSCQEMTSYGSNLSSSSFSRSSSLVV